MVSRGRKITFTLSLYFKIHVEDKKMISDKFAKVAKKVKLTYPILANLANVAVGILKPLG